MSNVFWEDFHTYWNKIKMYPVLTSTDILMSFSLKLKISTRIYKSRSQQYEISSKAFKLCPMLKLVN